MKHRWEEKHRKETDFDFVSFPVLPRLVQRANIASFLSRLVYLLSKEL